MTILSYPTNSRNFLLWISSENFPQKKNLIEKLGLYFGGKSNLMTCYQAFCCNDIKDRKSPWLAGYNFIIRWLRIAKIPAVRRAGNTLVSAPRNALERTGSHQFIGVNSLSFTQLSLIVVFPPVPYNMEQINLCPMLWEGHIASSSLWEVMWQITHRHISIANERGTIR